MKYLRRRRNYRRYGHQYPQRCLFVASLPKSGSTWIAAMLASLDGFERYTPAGWTADLVHDRHQDVYSGLFTEVNGQLAVIKGHTRGTPQNARALDHRGLRYFVTVRDPRDQVISAYWYIRNRPHHPEHRRASTVSLVEYIQHKLDSGEFERDTVEWIRLWCANRDVERSMLVRYEDLLADTEDLMQAAFEFLGFEVATETVRAIVEANSFERLARRSRGEEDRASFLRRGQPGEWRETWTPEQQSLFLRRFGDIVSAIGYPVD